jgi:hypothetical protein
VGRQLGVFAEKKLVSRDGLLVGRPDLIDTSSGEVVDYKTGSPLDESPDAISEAEARQLRLYVHLAQDNDLPISRAVIARADGRRTSMIVPREEADVEGRAARESLAQYNAAAGVTFNEAAQASPERCRFCSCIPFCESFWGAALPEWEEQCGRHIEGIVDTVEQSTMQGIKLTTLRVRIQRGTVAAREASVEQIPEAWITADGSEPPREGSVVRIVNGSRSGDEVPSVIRADRSGTSVWTSPLDAQP